MVERCVGTVVGEGKLLRQLARTLGLRKSGRSPQGTSSHLTVQRM